MKDLLSRKTQFYTDFSWSLFGRFSERSEFRKKSSQAGFAKWIVVNPYKDVICEYILPEINQIKLISVRLFFALQVLYQYTKIITVMNGPQRTTCFPKGMYNYTFALWTVHIPQCVMVWQRFCDPGQTKNCILSVCPSISAISCLWWRMVIS